jgi:hypothetical protein
MDAVMTEANSEAHPDLETVQTLVKQGKAVISAEDSAIIELANESN